MSTYPPVLPPSTWVVIPVKSLVRSKSRLAPVLAAEKRAALTRQFLQHTLAILNRVSAVAQVLVISGDETILSLGQEYGAFTLAENQPYGLNTAVSQAAQTAVHQGAESILVLPADLPFIQPADITMIIEAGMDIERDGRPTMIICSDNRNDGTNALLLNPVGKFTFHYGPGSLQRHLREAEKRRIIPHIIHLPSLAFDLDTEADWRIYSQRQSTKDILINPVNLVNPVQ